MGDATVTTDLLEVLRELLADRVTAAAAVRDHHSHGESYHQPSAPDIVAYPQTTEEISAIVRAASGTPNIASATTIAKAAPRLGARQR